MAVLLHTSKLVNLGKCHETFTILFRKQLYEAIKAFLLSDCDTVVVTILNDFVDNHTAKEFLERGVMQSHLLASEERAIGLAAPSISHH